MRKITTITDFLQDIAFLIDKNISFSVDKINEKIENKDLVEWLEKEFPFNSDNGLDFSLFKDTHKNWINQQYNEILGGYSGSERRKWGIEYNGLCLLISWGIEIIRDLDLYQEKDESEWL